MAQAQEQAQWMIEEHQRLDQRLLDQQFENEMRRQATHQSLLTSKKNAKAYRG